MFFENWFGLNSQRQRLLNKMPPEPLKSFLSVPFPDKNSSIKDLELLALDFETTGLKPDKNQILSIGYTKVSNGIIYLENSDHLVVNTKQKLVRNNVEIHKIMDSEQAKGLSLDIAIRTLLEALTGKVMLVHYAQIELNFLKQACLTLYGMAPVFPVVDTLMIAKRKFDLSDTAYDPSRLRLINLREEYQLPPHHEHNALNDAVATAELFLVMMSKLDNGLDTPLKAISY